MPASVLQQVNDHVAAGAKRLIEQFKETDVEKLLSIGAKQIQDFENVLWDIILKRLISQAEGVQLDAIGTIVGQPRNGMSDADYRLWIYARIRINRSFGRPEDIIEVSRLVLGDAAIFHYSEYYPCTVLVAVLTAITVNPLVVSAILREVKLAGVRLYFQYSMNAPADQFALESVTPGLVGPGKGYGYSADASVGGRLVSVRE